MEEPTGPFPIHSPLKRRDLSEPEMLEMVALLVKKGQGSIASEDSCGTTATHAAVTVHWRTGLDNLPKRTSRFDLDGLVQPDGAGLRHRASR